MRSAVEWSTFVRMILGDASMPQLGGLARDRVRNVRAPWPPLADLRSCGPSVPFLVVLRYLSLFLCHHITIFELQCRNASGGRLSILFRRKLKEIHAIVQQFAQDHRFDNCVTPPGSLHVQSNRQTIWHYIVICG